MLVDHDALEVLLPGGHRLERIILEYADLSSLPLVLVEHDARGVLSPGRHRRRRVFLECVEPDGPHLVFV